MKDAIIPQTSENQTETAGNYVIDFHILPRVDMPFNKCVENSVENVDKSMPQCIVNSHVFENMPDLSNVEKSVQFTFCGIGFTFSLCVTFFLAKAKLFHR